MGLRPLAVAAIASATIVLGGCCGDDSDDPVAPPPIRDPAKAKNLAERHQPLLMLEQDDGFWPVSVLTIDGFSHGGKGTCLAERKGAACDPVTVAELPWNEGPGSAYTDYPADHTDRGEQHDQAVGAVGSSALGTRAQLYFYLTGQGLGNPLTLQYWFYYPYNYLPVRGFGRILAETGLHEGDFEGMSLLLSARTHRPVYVWMPRHDEEAERFVWNQAGLDHRDGHPIGYVARGSHATYGSCGRKFRTIRWKTTPIVALPDDYADCGASDRYELGETVPVVNLARTGWACWEGHFGYSPGNSEPLSWHIADGPRSPLFQQKFDLDNPQPCTDVEAPEPAADPSQEIVGGPEISRELGVAGGRIDHRFRTCGQWAQRPPEGSYMVACDQATLDAFFESGLEEPGDQNLQVVGEPPPTGPTVPAVFSSRGSDAVDRAIVRTDETAQPEIYVAIRDGSKLKTAEFEQIELRPDQRLQLRRPSSSRWQLVDLAHGGEVVASAEVDVSRAATPPAVPSDIAVKRRGAEIELRFKGGSDPATRFVVVAGSSPEEFRGGGRPVGILRGDPSGAYRLTIADPEGRFLLLRIVASRDGALAASPLIEVPTDSPGGG